MSAAACSGPERIGTEPDDTQRGRGPLSSIRVADFSHIAAGPYSTLQLAYFGADVIKVESSRHLDGWRTRDGNADKEESRPFADHNKNKRSVSIDLKHPDGVRLAKRLVSACDVVVENFSLGVMERLGLGYDVLRQVRPGLVMMSLQGLGRSGPRRDWVTWGPSLMPLCGLTYLWNHPDAPEPTGSQTSYPDYVVALHAATVVLAALRRRDRTGDGCHLELAQSEVTATMIGEAFVDAYLTGRDPVPHGNGHPQWAPHGCYPCAGEDRWCVIAVMDDTQWRSLADLIGRGDLREDSGLGSAEGRRRRAAELDGVIGEWTRARTPREVMELCQGHGIAAGVVANGEDVVTDPNLSSRGFLVDTDHPRQPGLLLPSVAVHLSATPGGVHHPAPLLGEHTREVLAEVCHLDDADIESLDCAEVLR